eukprot:352812-Pleurochrysis_carterae.AAC.1
MRDQIQSAAAMPQSQPLYRRQSDRLSESKPKPRSLETLRAAACTKQPRMTTAPRIFPKLLSKRCRLP